MRPVHRLLGVESNKEANTMTSPAPIIAMLSAIVAGLLCWYLYPILRLAVIPIGIAIVAFGIWLNGYLFALWKRKIQ